MTMPFLPRVEVRAAGEPVRFARAARPEDPALRERRFAKRMEALHRRTFSAGAYAAVTASPALGAALQAAARERFAAMRGLNDAREVLGWLVSVAGDERPSAAPGSSGWTLALTARATRALLWRAFEVWINVQPRIGRSLAVSTHPAEIESYFTTRFVALVLDLRTEHWRRLEAFYGAGTPERWVERWPEERR